MKLLGKALKWLVIGIACLFVIAQFRRPARTNPPVDQSQTIEAHAQMTPQVASILQRSCTDCHSNKTAWPWYTNVAPVSWFITDHVNEGRSHLNLSEWGRNDQRRKTKKLQEICEEVQKGAMPLSSYTPLHPHAKLSADDVKVLCDWTETERVRLAAP